MEKELIALELIKCMVNNKDTVDIPEKFIEILDKLEEREKNKLSKENQSSK